MTKDNITIAALRLFLLNGYKNVSLVDVANEVGITKGGIYHYFDSKEALLHTSVSFLFDKVETKLAELFNSLKNFKDILAAIMVDREIEVFIEQLLGLNKGDYRANNAGLALEVMHSYPGFQDRLDQSHVKFLQAVEQSIAKAQANNEVRQDIDPHTLATIIFALLSGQNVLSPALISLVIRQQTMDTIWAFISN